MQHHATVANCPLRAARTLLANKPIFDSKNVVRELFVVEEVAERFIVLFVSVVANLEETVFDAKGVRKIVSQFVIPNLRLPASKILSVQKGNPLAFFDRISCNCGGGNMIK